MNAVAGPLLSLSDDDRLLAASVLQADGMAFDWPAVRRLLQAPGDTLPILRHLLAAGKAALKQRYQPGRAHGPRNLRSLATCSRS